MVFTFNQFRKYELHTAQVEHTYQVISVLQNIKGNFATEAYMRRGYVLFPESSMEQGALLARENLLAQIDTLRNMVDDNESQKTNTHLLMDMLADTAMSMNKWGLYLRLDSSRRTEYIKHDIARTIASQKYDAIYGHIEEMLEHENQLFLERTDHQQASARTTPLLFITLTTAALVFLLYSFWQIQKEFATKLKVQGVLVKTLRDLNLKNEELERLSLLTAHHFKEPLRKAQTFLSKVTDHADLQAQHQRALQRATHNLEHMQQLLHDLSQYYTYALHNSKETDQISLDAALRHALGILQANISQSGAQVELSGSLPTVRGHHEHLQFLFRELLYNALKYHREGTVPHIRIWASSDQAARLWLVHIRDEGIGIEPAYQKRIFQVFERLHSTRAYAGTGIGLAICRRIMLAYGGNISVESEAGAYSTFTLAFPMQAQKMD